MDLFWNSMGPVEKCLRDYGIDKRDVHEVVLVGGSTRISTVQATVTEFCVCMWVYDDGGNGSRLRRRPLVPSAASSPSSRLCASRSRIARVSRVWHSWTATVWSCWARSSRACRRLRPLPRGARRSNEVEGQLPCRFLGLRLASRLLTSK